MVIQIYRYVAVIIDLLVQFHSMDSDPAIPVHQGLFLSFGSTSCSSTPSSYPPTTASSSFPSILFFRTTRPAQKHQTHCTG